MTANIRISAGLSLVFMLGTMFIHPSAEFDQNDLAEFSKNRESGVSSMDFAGGTVVQMN